MEGEMNRPAENPPAIVPTAQQAGTASSIWLCVGGPTDFVGWVAEQQDEPPCGFGF
tara:strand:+ start:506 stop:673 length:168 start_codon:yes stop_codon:yes gene_type:complete